MSPDTILFLLNSREEIVSPDTILSLLNSREEIVSPHTILSLLNKQIVSPPHYLLNKQGKDIVLFCTY